MNKIILVTTVGCASCSIMKNIIANTIKTLEDKSIEVETKDISNVDNWITINVPLNDFPTTLLIKDNVIKYSFSGTTNITKLKKLINEIFY